MYLDLNYSPLPAAPALLPPRLAERRLARPRSDAPARLFLCAHYDAARTGAVFRPKRIARCARLAARVSRPAGALPGPVLGARRPAADPRRPDGRLDSGLISALQLVPTLILLLGAFLLVDISSQSVVPGANDNASGVATVLSLAEELDATAARQPRRLGRSSPAPRSACRRECALSSGLTAPTSTARRPTSSTSTRSATATVRYEAAAGLGGQPTGWTAAWSSCATRSPTADSEEHGSLRRPAAGHGLAGDCAAAACAGFPATTITCSNDAELVPGYHALTTARTGSTPPRSTAPTASRSSSCGPSTATSAAPLGCPHRARR